MLEVRVENNQQSKGWEHIRLALDGNVDRQQEMTW